MHSLKLFLFILSLSSDAFAHFPRCATIFSKNRGTDLIAQSTLIATQNHLHSEENQGVPRKHQTQFLIHQRDNQPVQTDTVVLVFHGLFNSPRDMQFVARDFFKNGANVINARLDGHFEAKRDELDTVTYKDWVAQLDGYYKLAQSYGKNVVIVGHSTGGLAAIQTAISRRVDRLILLAPALKTRFTIDLLTYSSSKMGLSGWLLEIFGIPSNERYASTFAGVQVDRWGDFLRALPAQKSSTSKEYGLLEERLEQIPILWFDTAIDRLVDSTINESLSDRLDSSSYFIFPRESNVKHNSIAIPQLNKDYSLMINMMKSFVVSEASP